jgi:hypothetical protein
MANAGDAVAFPSALKTRLYRHFEEYFAACAACLPVLSVASPVDDAAESVL